MQCPLRTVETVPPLVQNGVVNFQARHVGYIVTALFTLASVITSAWLVQKHLKWYSCKPHQRHIVRLLFMVPIYASITLASYLSLANATSLLLVRDAYESVVLASFFSLLLEYLAGPRFPAAAIDGKRKDKKRDKNEKHKEREPLDTASVVSGTEQIHAPLTKAERATVVHKVFYRVPMYPDPRNTHKPLKWIFPLGSVRARPKDGLSYLHWMRWGVLQYCIVRPGSTLAAVILQQFNLYCETSWSWRWGHVYIVTIVSVSVTVAMYCLIQLYTTISVELRPYRPLLKLFAVKAVVFLTFWQSALLSGLASLNIIKDTEYMTAEDTVVGFSALLQTFEMMCFAFLHVKAFSYVPYKQIARLRTQPTRPQTTTRDADMPPLLSPPLPRLDPEHRLPASAKQQFMNLIQAFTFTDTFRDLRAGVLYFFGRGASREADDVCRREERFREVFGRDRERSFMRIHGYKGLPQDEDRTKLVTASGLRYSPLPTPPQEEYDDPPPVSLLRREQDVGEYVAPRLEYGSRREYAPVREYEVPGQQQEYATNQRGYAPLTEQEYVPHAQRDYAPPAQIEYAPPQRTDYAPPPRGAYVPAYGPGPSLGWNRNGMVTPPRTPVFVSPGRVPGGGSPNLSAVGSPLQIPSVPHVPGITPPPSTSPPHAQVTSPTRGSSRRIGDVYVGGTRGVEFVPRTTGSPVSPKPVGSPISPRLGGTPISPLSGGTPTSPLSAAPITSRSDPLACPQPKGPPRAIGTHISPDSAQMLAQTSPLFQQSFGSGAQGYPLSPVSPPMVRVAQDLAPPRTSGETQRTQRNSGFTLPPWASGTPTHSQWPSNVTSSRRTSANTMDPPSPTRGRRLSTQEEVEPPSSSRSDSLLARVFSGATRTTDRTRDSESGGARTSLISVRTGECVSSSNNSDEGACVQPARAVSFRSGAPALVRLDGRRDSITSPSLVSSSVRERRADSPSSTSSRPTPSSDSPSLSLPSPPEVARPLRRMSAGLQSRVPRGPRTQPRTVTLPAPLSPARYPHSPWRPTITRSGLGHVSSVHATVSHWNPLRPPSSSSSEGGLAGRAAGRSSIGAVASPGPEYTAMSSLSSLSNIEDRYPVTPRRDS